MFTAHVNDQSFEIVFSDKQTSSGSINGLPFSLDRVAINDRRLHVIHNNRSYCVQVVQASHASKSFVIRVNQHQYTAQVADRFDALLKHLGMDNLNTQKFNVLKAPMPGLVLRIEVAEGDQVAEGDSLLVLEAMKMENVLKAPGGGVVKHIAINNGQAVEKNETLIEFE